MHHLIFQLFPDATGSWRVRVRFPNGRIFATSEDYGARREAQDSLAAVLQASASPYSRVVDVDQLGAQTDHLADQWLADWQRRRHLGDHAEEAGRS